MCPGKGVRADTLRGNASPAILKQYEDIIIWKNNQLAL
jgi:hypothetical protein